MAESVGKWDHLDDGLISYSPSDVIGRGGFGVVYRGFMDVKNFEDQSVAIKKIHLSCYTGKARDKEPMINLKHENFVKIVKVVTDDEFRYLVMEMCVGTLAQVVDLTYKGPDLPSEVSVFRDIASGLHYIHTAKLMHLNIKPENILISKDARIKISDLGFFGRSTRSDNCWLAPEVLEILSIGRTRVTRSDKNISWKVTPSSDIFSAGCVFFFYFTRGVRRGEGIHPFGSGYIEQSKNIRKNRPINVEGYYFSSREAIRKMITHNPRDRLPLPEVIKTLEELESERMNHLRECDERLNLESTGLHNDVTATDGSVTLLRINEEDYQLDKDDIVPETAKGYAAVTSVNRQTKIDKNYCLKDEPMDTGNMFCETMNPNRPPAAPDGSVSFVADSRVKTKSEIKEEVETGIEVPMEKSEFFKQTSFPLMKTKKVAFHPILPDVLCCETLKGDVLIIQISDNSFSGFSCHIRDSDIKKLQGRKPFSIGWNVNGTRLAAGYKYGHIVIWEFPGRTITFSQEFNFIDPRMEWNPFQPDRLAIYNWKHKLMVIIDEKLCTSVKMDFHAGVMTLAWVSANKIACGLFDGSLNIYLISENFPQYSCATIKKFENEKNSIVKCLKWSQECGILASGSYNGYVKFWSLEEKKPIFTYRSENGLRCHALDWLHKAIRNPPNQVTEMTQQPSRLLACGFANGSIIIINPINTSVQKTLLGHTGDVNRVLFSPDGKYLISSSLRAKEKAILYGKEIRIWSTETWTLHFNVDSTRLEKVAFDWNALSNKVAVAYFTFHTNEKARLATKLDILSVV